MENNNNLEFLCLWDEARKPRKQLMYNLWDIAWFKATEDLSPERMLKDMDKPELTYYAFCNIEAGDLADAWMIEIKRTNASALDPTNNPNPKISDTITLVRLVDDVNVPIETYQFTNNFSNFIKKRNLDAAASSSPFPVGKMFIAQLIKGLASSQTMFQDDVMPLMARHNARLSGHYDNEASQSEVKLKGALDLINDQPS